MNVFIKIDTIQSDNETGKTDKITLKTDGRLKSIKGVDIISYEEENSGVKAGKTIIKLQDNSITMIKYAQNSNMYFKKNLLSQTEYKTMYGNFKINIFTKDLKITKNNNNLYEIHIDYDIIIDTLFEGNNKMKILVRKID